MMNEQPRQKLCELIARHGTVLCDEPGRCEGCLRDFCAQHRGEVNVLINALKERVAVDLLNSSASIPIEVSLARLVKRLREHQGMHEEAARWAVESWALALGRMTQQDLRPDSAESAAPRIDKSPVRAISPTAPTGDLECLDKPVNAPALPVAAATAAAGATDSRRRRWMSLVIAWALLTVGGVVWYVGGDHSSLTLRGHGGSVKSVAFSPDGRRIVTGSWDHTARVWDVESGQELLTLSGHSLFVNSAAFSPDGRRIVTGSNDETARVWDAESGQEQLMLKGHSGSVLSAAFSPDGRRIVTGGADKTARVWDAQSGQEQLTLSGHAYDVTSVAFSPDGTRIMTCGSDAKIWDANSDAVLLTLRGSFVQAVFSSDGRRIVTGSYDETAKVWDAQSGQEQITLKGRSGWVTSVAISPDGRRIVTGSWDKTARVWDVLSGQELRPLTGHSSEVTAVAFSPDGRQIVTGSSDMTAKVWESPK